MNRHKKFKVSTLPIPKMTGDQNLNMGRRNGGADAIRLEGS